MRKLILIFTLTIFAFINVRPGKIIILNGMSSAGKSTIAKKLVVLLGKSYQTISLDDFIADVFVQQTKIKLPQKEFLKKVRQQTDAMYEQIRKITSLGKNVVLDTLLSGLEGEKDVMRNVAKLKGFGVTLILIHCPLSDIMKRLNSRNKKAELEKKQKDMRSMVVALKIKDVYRTRKRKSEIYIGSLSRKEIDLAYQAVKTESPENTKLFQQIKQNLLTHFELDTKKSVKLTPQLRYDYIIDTSKNSAEQCVKQIYDFLKKSRLA